MTVDNALVLAASLTYLVATLVYGGYMLRFDARYARAGLALLCLGAALHLAAVAARGVLGNLAPALYDGLLISSACLVCGWLGWQLRSPGPMFGAFLSPIATMVLYSLHVFHRETGQLSTVDVGIITPIHIATSTVGFAIFAVAAVAAALEILQEYRLKTKRVTLGQKHIPSLRRLERVSHRALIIGFPIYSVGVALGAVWFVKLDDPIVTRHVVMATFSWVLYALLIHARVSIGLKGRRAAVITLAAFASALFVVLLSALRLGA